MSLAIVAADTYLNDKVSWSRELGPDHLPSDWPESDRPRWARILRSGVDYRIDTGWVIEKGVEEARRLIEKGPVLSACVTLGGAAIAIVRRNLDVDADP